MDAAFCYTEFWDLNVTWYAEVPDFTVCFQNTVLVLAPCLFFSLIAVFCLWHTSRQIPKLFIPWTVLNTTKLILCVMLTCLSISELTFNVYKRFTVESAPDIVLCSSFAKCSTFVLVLLMLLQHKRFGIRSSTVLSMFWLVLSICGTIMYRSSLLQIFSDNIFSISKDQFILDMFYYPLVLTQFFLSLFYDGKDNQAEKDVSPLDKETFFSFITFHWFNSIIFKSRKQLLVVSEFPPLSSKLLTNTLWLKFSNVWNKRLRKKSNRNICFDSSVCESKDQVPGSPSLILTLVLSLWPWIVYSVVLELTFDVIRFLPPLLLNLIIEFADSDEYAWRGYLYCFTLFFSNVINLFVYNMLVFYSICAALQLKSALLSAIYRKTLKISNSTRRNYTVGEMVNLMAVDVDKVFNFWMFSTLIFGAPLRIIITLIFLWQFLGPSTLAGLAVIVLMIPLSLLVARKNHKIQEKQMETKDLRLKHMNEILNGIKVLKLCAWEIPFLNKIIGIRSKEVRLIKTFQFCYAIFSFIWCCAPFFVAVASFVTFVLVDEKNILDPSTAFVSLNLLNMLRFSLFEIPDLLSQAVQTNIALRRLRTFLTSDERCETDIGKTPNKGEAISVNNAVLSWSIGDEPTLKNINFHVKEGSLVAIVGQVGSGKSSLLSAMLGDMHKLSGSLDIKGQIAYVPQQAWILNQTVRQNILFIKTMNEVKYYNIIQNCCLKPDLEMLPGGDMTEIGEKGVNLSGGQKQRISLARAVYQNADIYLLDDPLSAVDSHVGRHLFDHVIGQKGLLREKTRVLVTHNISVLSEVDLIVSMNDGGIAEVGTYKTLMDQNGPFAEFIKNHQNHQDSNELNESLDKVGDLKTEREHLELIRAKSVIDRSLSSLSNTIMLRTPSVESINKKITFQLVEEEAMEIGKVKRSVYTNYVQNSGIPIVFSVFLGYLVYNIFEISGNIWLSEWSSDTVFPNGTQDADLRDLRIGVYAALGTSQAFAILLGTIMLAIGSARASKIFHQKMLHSVMRSPMSFFDTTPMGRIINRFGKDIDVLDTEIPAELDGWLSCLLSAVGTCFVIGMSTPLFLVFLIPIGILYYFIQKLYMISSRQIKRLESVTRSPIFSHFSETVQGVSSIRSYNATEEFISKSENQIDTNVCCYFYWIASNRWLGIRLDVVGNIIVLVASVLAVSNRGILDASIVGLSLTYALSITDVLTWLVRTGTELENKLVSVERIDEYSKLDSEAPWKIEDTQPLPTWPMNGAVSFVNYSTRYRENLDLVLKEINLKISSSEKIGIVGRTGAGKSSFTLALFRIIEAVEGTVMIDDVDVTKIGLHDLRSKLTIIPQDPVLFTGTLRINLDPNGNHSDGELWESLEHAHLKSYIVSLNEGLDYNISEGGENLSVGQRQLICLARALLKKTKILILDEATAAVDMETDRLIQNTIRSEFNHHTVITIAHRLHTILDYDKVVVMEAGQIVEIGAPSELLQKKDSKFYFMAKDAGLA